MLLPRSRRRLSSISERITAGEPPLNPPLVARPRGVTSTPANFTRSSPRASTHRVDRHDHAALARPVARAQVDAVLGADQVCELVVGIRLDLRVAPQLDVPMRIGMIEEHHADLWVTPEVLRLLPAGVERDLHRAVLRQEP